MKASGKHSPEVICSHELARRVAGAYDVLLREAPSRGIEVKPGSKTVGGVGFVRGEDVLHLTFEEAMETVEREPTPEEKRRPSWEGQTTSTKPSGRLSIRLSSEQPFKGARSWSESGTRSLEEILPMILMRMEGVYRALEDRRAAEARQKAEWEERQRQWKQESDEREHQQKLQEVATGRFRLLRRASEWFHIHREVLEFIQACEEHWQKSQDHQLTEEQQAWLRWARSNAALLSPFNLKYPDPSQDGPFDGSAVPFKGPYPKFRKMTDRNPQQQSGYGYSRDEPLPNWSSY